MPSSMPSSIPSPLNSSSSAHEDDSTEVLLQRLQDLTTTIARSRHLSHDQVTEMHALVEKMEAIFRYERQEGNLSGNNTELTVRKRNLTISEPPLPALTPSPTRFFRSSIFRTSPSRSPSPRKCDGSTGRRSSVLGNAYRRFSTSIRTKGDSPTRATILDDNVFGPPLPSSPQEKENDSAIPTAAYDTEGFRSNFVHTRDSQADAIRAILEKQRNDGTDARINASILASHSREQGNDSTTPTTADDREEFPPNFPNGDCQADALRTIFGNFRNGGSPFESPLASSSQTKNNDGRESTSLEVIQIPLPKLVPNHGNSPFPNLVEILHQGNTKVQKQSVVQNSNKTDISCELAEASKELLDRLRMLDIELTQRASEVAVMNVFLSQFKFVPARLKSG